MIMVKRNKNNEIKNYDYLTIEEILNRYETYHDSIVIHNGHVVGFIKD